MQRHLLLLPETVNSSVFKGRLKQRPVINPAGDFGNKPVVITARAADGREEKDPCCLNLSIAPFGSTDSSKLSFAKMGNNTFYKFNALLF